MVVVTEFTHPCDGEHLRGYAVAPPPGVPPRPGHVVLLHGAGTGTKELLRPLARDFADVGHRAVAVDFSGHGESSGTLPELSLRRRCRQAAGVIEAFVPAGEPLVLAGFSMSGQTVADLVERYGPRVATVCLCSPGVYAPQAWDVPFGGGFTELIRRPGSWADSRAFEEYARFAGRAVLVLPESDEVIPPGVTAGIERALRGRARLSTLVLEGAGHRLARWLSGHPEHRRRVVRAVTGDADRTRAAPPSA